jgi:hypothetical protein
LGYRPAHVLAFAAFVDWFHRWLWDNHAAAVQAGSPRWSLNEAEDMREYSDHQVI